MPRLRPGWLHALAFGLAALVILTGCGAPHTGRSATTLRIWYSTDDPVERVWSQQLATQFERLHPDVQVTLNALSFEDLNTKLQLALSAGDPPDLAYVTPRGPGIPAYLGAHKLLDLTSAAQRHHWAIRLRPGLLTAYNRPFGFDGAPPGHVWAVPTSLAAVGIMVNSALLHRLHLSLPHTLAQFNADLGIAHAAGYTPIGIGNGDGWLGDDWYLTLVNAAVPPASLAPEQVRSASFSFRGAPFAAAATQLQRWSQAGYLTPDFGGLDAQEGVDQFFRGHTLFQLISSSENAQIKHDEEQTRLPIGVFAFPGTQGGSVMPDSGYLGWVVPAASTHRALAIDFINSLLSPATTRLLLRQGVLPAAPTNGAGVAAAWQRQYLASLDSARPGVYLDAAPVPNLNATMEANVQLLLQGYEAPGFLVKSLDESYRGKSGSTARIDGEF